MKDVLYMPRLCCDAGNTGMKGHTILFCWLWFRAVLFIQKEAELVRHACSPTKLTTSLGVLQIFLHENGS